MLKIKHIVLFLFTLLFPFILQATEKTTKMPSQNNAKGFLYGIGLGVNQEIYKGYKRRTIPLPLIGYTGERLTVYGPFISYKVQNFENISLALNLAPRFQGFDDSDSDIFVGMKKRKFSIDAGFSVNYKKDNWKASLSSLFDVLNQSGGYEFKSSLGHTFKFGPVFIEPSVSVSLLDSKHVDYYYGVKSSEVNENRTTYRGVRALNTGVGLSIATPIFFNGFTRVNIEYWQFDSAITNSPLVDSENSVSAQLLFTKMF